jgi:hypothetical protein
MKREPVMKTLHYSALDGTNLGSAFPTRTIRVSRQPKIVEEQLRANL